MDGEDEEILQFIDRMGRTKKRIIIELYRQSVGYKKLSKILGVGLDTIRSHIKSGKYSTSLLRMGIVERGEKGWQLSVKGLMVCEHLRENPEFKAFFYEGLNVSFQKKKEKPISKQPENSEKDTKSEFTS